MEAPDFISKSCSVRRLQPSFKSRGWPQGKVLARLAWVPLATWWGGPGRALPGMSLRDAVARGADSRSWQRRALCGLRQLHVAGGAPRRGECLLPRTLSRLAFGRGETDLNMSQNCFMRVCLPTCHCSMSVLFYLLVCGGACGCGCGG